MPDRIVAVQRYGGVVLQAQGLAAFRGERLVFAGLSFSVPAGGALLLTGPNGSGKSTLLRLLAGLGRAEAGRLLWDGADALADLPAHAARVRYLGHQDAVKPGLTVAENLRFWGGRRGGRAGAGGGRSAAAGRPAGAHALGRAEAPAGDRPAGDGAGGAVAAGRADAGAGCGLGGAVRRVAGGASGARAGSWWRRRICRCRWRGASNFPSP